MSDNRYRLCIVILLTIFVVGALAIGFQMSQNGRYIQYDLRGTYSPDGQTHMQEPPYRKFDTRTGRIEDP